MATVNAKSIEDTSLLSAGKRKPIKFPTETHPEDRDQDNVYLLVLQQYGLSLLLIVQGIGRFARTLYITERVEKHILRMKKNQGIHTSGVGGSDGTISERFS